ncbi:MAG: class I SAM-dependent methyltransferase [Tissierellales bacterium]|jgi:ubiquinone/menaquinone biosynthesis C-methylase UbiE|nr:class I SAM-dependent methyltransferase [Tissierellales bacterium]
MNVEQKQKLKETFNIAAKEYINNEYFNEFCENLFGLNLNQYNHLTKKQLDFLLSNMMKDKIANILDLGSGSGIISEYVSKSLSAKVTGIDFADVAVKMANERNKSNALINFLEMDFDELTFRDDEFDAVVSIDTLYFSSDLHKLIKQLKRITKNGGKLYIFLTTISNGKIGEEIDIKKILRCEKLSFSFTDFTEDERRFWTNHNRVIEEMRRKYSNENLLEELYIEGEYLLKYISENKVSRGFYMVENNAKRT